MRENGLRALGGLAQRLTSSIAKGASAKGRGTSIIRLRADWPVIVGPELARTTRPDALLAGRGGRTGAKVLRLRVSSAAALEVQHMTGQIVERVNAYFGHRQIDDIRLAQGVIVQPPVSRPPPAPPPEVTAQMATRVADVADADLAELFITSVVSRGEDLHVTKTDHHKCGRCWRHLPDVAEDGALCARCDDVVAQIDSLSA